MILKSNALQKLSLHIGRATNIFYYLFDQGKKEITYKINGSKFRLRVNTADKFSVWETWKYKAYSEKGFSIQSTDTIIDLGAHIGSFSVYAATHTPDGKVYAYEPEPGNFRLLKENKSLNNLDNLQIFQEAVMGRKGKIKLWVERNIASINTIFENDNKIFRNSIDVLATTLEKIINDNKLSSVDLLKVDVEGAEYDVFLNSNPSIFSKIKKISLEYHDHLNHGHNVKELEELFQKNGFKTKFINIFFITRFLKYGLLRAWKD